MKADSWVHIQSCDTFLISEVIESVQEGRNKESCISHKFIESAPGLEGSDGLFLFLFYILGSLMMHSISTM